MSYDTLRVVIISGLKILPSMPQMLTDGLHPSNFGFTQHSKLLAKKLVALGINP